MKMSRICPAIVATLTVFAISGCADEDQGLVGRRSPTREDNTPTTATNDPNNTAGDDIDTPKHQSEENRPTLGEQGAGASATGTGSTAMLNSYSKVVIDQALFPGPQQNGVPRLGKVTGAGNISTQVSYAQLPNNNIRYLVTSTVSDSTRNQNSPNNSYLRGAVATGLITAEGVKEEAVLQLPKLNGDRAANRLISHVMKDGRAIVIMASEDNGVNNNPQPVAFVIDLNKATAGAAVQNITPEAIPNSNRKNNGVVNVNKPANLIVIGNQQGRNIPNPNNQRGPHTINAVPGEDNAVIVGMQYNNQASEAFKLTVGADNTLTMNWFRRVSNTAQHCRPSVAISEDGKTLYHAAVEANNQPAEIGWRLTELNPATGQIIKSKIAVRTIEKNGNNGGEYVSEPRIAIVPGTNNVVATYGKSYLARDRNNNNNGHAEDGSKMVVAAIFEKGTLNMMGQETRGVGVFGRHGSSYVTQYGPKGEPALAVITGSSTGTGKGFVSMYPIKPDMTLGLKDSMKTYPASPYADLANVQARGLRNPNNQARGFIEGIGMVPNPGYVADANDPKNKTNFMPEVKYVSMAAITGYKDAVTAKEGKRNSAYLSLVPAVWREGLATAPGQPTPLPGTDPNGNPSEVGPSPKTNAPPTNTDPDSTSDGTVTNGDETNPGDATGGSRRNPNMGAADGCSTSGGSPVGSFGFIGLAVAGVLVALRRKREEA